MIPSHHPVTAVQPSPLLPLGLAAVCMGLFNVMWNFLGWDNAFTIAEEVETPIRSYFIAIGGALLVIVAMYFCSILTSAHSALLRMRLPGAGISHEWMVVGALLSAGGMVSTPGLFLAILLAISRIPKVMADDRLLPASLQRLHPISQVPHVFILTCAVVVSFMVLWNFGDLFVIDVTLYGAALMPGFFALIALRKHMPDSRRPFRIPLQIPGLIAMTLLPALCILLALTGLLATCTVHLTAAWFAFATVATGPFAWFAIRRRRLPRGIIGPEVKGMYGVDWRLTFHYQRRPPPPPPPPDRPPRPPPPDRPPPQPPPPPPPPRGRSVLGLASLTSIERPFNSFPLSSSMAFCASVWSGISTKPNPLGTLLNLSFTMTTSSTLPNAWKVSRKSSSLTSRDKLPT